MMALAVDVGGDRAAERHEAGAGHHRRKKSARQKDPNDFVEGHAGLGVEDSRFGIEAEHAVQALEIDHAVFAVERRVAVRASRAARDQLMGIGRNDRGKFRKLFRPKDIALANRIAAPSAQRGALAHGHRGRHAI